MVTLICPIIFFISKTQNETMTTCLSGESQSLPPIDISITCSYCPRCLQNYIPAHSLTLSCPVCRQTSILPEKGVAALQSNFFITNLMEVLKRSPDADLSEDCTDAINGVATGQPLSCPNHGGNVRLTQQHRVTKCLVYRSLTVRQKYFPPSSSCILFIFNVKLLKVFVKGVYGNIV